MSPISLTKYRMMHTSTLVSSITTPPRGPRTLLVQSPVTHSHPLAAIQERPKSLKTRNLSRSTGLPSKFLPTRTIRRPSKMSLLFSVSAYFGDLKDGTHKGDQTDPRIAVIEVIPDEIRYWIPTKSVIGRAIDAGVGAMTGRTSAPGEIRTITKAEVRVQPNAH